MVLILCTSKGWTPSSTPDNVYYLGLQVLITHFFGILIKHHEGSLISLTTGCKVQKQHTKLCFTRRLRSVLWLSVVATLKSFDRKCELLTPQSPAEFQRNFVRRLSLNTSNPKSAPHELFSDYGALNNGFEVVFEVVENEKEPYLRSKFCRWLLHSLRK